MAVGNQRLLLTLHIKNKLRGKAAELVNSRNPATWNEVRHLLETHFGDSRDLTSLIQDLQRISQLPNETPLNFVSRLQTHNAKMHAAIQKQTLTADQKESQSHLIETMTLNTLLTGLDSKLGAIVRASDPADMLQAINRIKKEIQLSYFESQKFSRIPQNPNLVKKPNGGNFQKTCTFCKRVGHLVNECRTRQQQNSNSQNFPRPNFQNHFPMNNPSQNFSNNFPRPQYNSNNFQRPQFNQNNFQRPQTSQNQFQNRPLAIRPNPNANFNQPRPSIIRPNPNFNQQRTHHVNYDNNYEHCYQDYSDNYVDFQNYDCENLYEDPQGSYNYDLDTNPHSNHYYDNSDLSYDPYYSEYANQNASNETDLCQNFQAIQVQDEPGGTNTQTSPANTMSNSTQIQTVNVNHPNLCQESKAQKFM